MTQNPVHFTSYREIIQREFDKRAQNDPSYTLRAFARELGVSPSQLSEILNGKHGLSIEKATSFAKTLRLRPKEAKFFCDSVESCHGRSPMRREAAKARLVRYQLGPHYHQITLDHFAIIADWYHFGILKLLELENAKSDVSWISAALGIDGEATAAAIERLVRVGLLTQLNHKLSVNEAYVSTPTDIPSEAIKRFHQQILDSAKKSLYADPIDKRDFFVTLMPMDPGQIPEVKLEINEFHNRLNRLTEQGAKKTAVYCLASQFFPVAQTEKV